MREFLDLHAALAGGHGQVGTVGPVEQHREVVLLSDACALGDHDPTDGQVLDRQREDVLRALGRLLRGLGELDAARLTPPPALTWALTTTTGLFSLLAAAAACSGVSATMASSTGTRGPRKDRVLVFVQIHGWSSTTGTDVGPSLVRTG